MPAISKSQRPLGLKTTFDVSANTLGTLRFIEGFDLERIEEKARPSKLIGAGGPTLEFKRFLALPVLYPGPQDFPFVPSRRLDALWHAFILNTPRYREFCDRVYGGYLDHVPGKSRIENRRTIQRGSMQFTVERISETFDNVSMRYWNKLTFCGPCLSFKR